MLDLFGYLNYRHYLKDFYREQKEKRGARFSFRLFSRQAGLKSPNFLKLVIDGKRNLGPDGIESFIKGLRLGKEESVFFENLVHFNQATTDEERTEWYRRLATSRRYREIRQIEKDQFVYFSRWYYAAARELVLLPDFQDDPEWVSQKLSPSISVKEAAAALELLKKIGYIKKEKSGRWVQADRNISTAREVASLAVSNFHRQMMEQAAQSIEKTVPEHRDISSLTVALSREKFAEAKRRIQDFRRELNVLLSEEGNADAVYQLNFQLFNLSEVPWPLA